MQDAYLDLALPVLGGTLRALENESEQGVQDPILRRRLRCGQEGRLAQGASLTFY